jgi:hypothetical protein
MTNLNKLVTEVTTLPLHDHRRELPAKILPQRLILWAVVMLKSAHEPIGIVDGSTAADDRKVSYSIWH